MASAHPFDQLTPHAVLDMLESLGLRGDGRLLQLNSYENRVFQVTLESGETIVAKFYRPDRWTDAQIQEEHHFALELDAAEVPVVAPMPLQIDARPGRTRQGTLGMADVAGLTFRIAAYPRFSGHGPELEQLPTLQWLGRFIGRLHAVGARRPFLHRRCLDADSVGGQALRRLDARARVTVAEASAWRDAAQRALEMAHAAFARVRFASLRLHGDCHAGNILWRSPDEGMAHSGPRIVDLDDAVNGPAVQDLWMWLSGERADRQRQLAAVLQGYQAFRDFDGAELALIEPLRTLRMLHHSAWIAERWDDPAFPAAFPWFGTAAYWAQQTVELREQLAAMAEPPLRTNESAMPQTGDRPAEDPFDESGWR
jgi:Ser/Thr protein kinase RdoA (MazF antagonist)